MVFHFFLLFVHLLHLVEKLASVALLYLLLKQFKFSFGPLKLELEILLLTSLLLTLINQPLKRPLVFSVVIESKLATL